MKQFLLTYVKCPLIRLISLEMGFAKMSPLVIVAIVVAEIPHSCT